jgi:hypothetical protein
MQSMRAGFSFSYPSISLLLGQPLSIKKSYAGAIQDHKWKLLILVVNFFLALRVNEIPNKTDLGNI